MRKPFTVKDVRIDRNFRELEREVGKSSNGNGFDESEIDHDKLKNTHNLTIDIDHSTITNTHNLTTDIDHDALANFVANEHMDYTGVLNATHKVVRTTVKARAYATAQLNNIADMTDVIVPLGGESYDPGGHFSSNRFLTPCAGYYHLAGSVYWINVEAQDGYYVIITNGTTRLMINGFSTPNLIDPLYRHVSGTVYLASGVSIYLRARAEGTGGGTDVGAGVEKTWLSVHLLSI